MASVVQFSVDDSSPTVSYSPFGDTFSSPNLSAGWNPHWDNPGFSGATNGSAGSGNSTHITSLDGASLQIQWKGARVNSSHIIIPEHPCTPQVPAYSFSGTLPARRIMLHLMACLRMHRQTWLPTPSLISRTL